MTFCANLDCEVVWAGAPPLPAHVRAGIAALGTLCRVWADAVETIEAVDPARVPGGFVRGHGAADAHWGTRDRALGARAADRRLAASVEDALGARPAGAAIVTSIEELEERLPEAAAPTGRWVAKAAVCAAGRDRVHRRGAALDDATRTRLARLLARGGALALEPWLERSVDLGQCGHLGPDGVSLLPPHRLLCDATGGFAGIVVDDASAAAYAADLAAAARAAGAALAQVGYAGPFAIDAFVYGDTLRPLVEINPRHTFGHVARAWADRTGLSVLEVGRGAPPPDAHALLLPGVADPTSAWLRASW